MSDEKIFAEGMYFKEKPSAPDFVLGGLSFKVSDAIAWLKEHENEKGYVNCDLKRSKGGENCYLELDTWKPSEDYKKTEGKPKNEPEPEPEEDDDLPF